MGPRALRTGVYGCCPSASESTIPNANFTFAVSNSSQLSHTKKKRSWFIVDLCPKR